MDSPTNTQKILTTVTQKITPHKMKSKRKKTNKNFNNKSTITYSTLPKVNHKHSVIEDLYKNNKWKE